MSDEKKDKLQETTLTPTLEESTSVSGVNFGQKVFSHQEKTTHIELEATTEPETPPTAKPPLAAPVKDKAPAPHPPSAPRPIIRPSPAITRTAERTSFFLPSMVLLAVLAAGYFFYQRYQQAAIVPPILAIPPSPPASLPSPAPAIETPPDTVMNKPTDPAEEENSAAVFNLKSDTDDFTVLVNGKDVPVISGKISLPLNQNLDIRFTRRGYKEIKMSANLKKPETRLVPLHFEKDPNPPPPRRLYN